MAFSIILDLILPTDGSDEQQYFYFELLKIMLALSANLKCVGYCNNVAKGKCLTQLVIDEDPSYVLADDLLPASLPRIQKNDTAPLKHQILKRADLEQLIAPHKLISLSQAHLSAHKVINVDADHHIGDLSKPEQRWPNMLTSLLEKGAPADAAAIELEVLLHQLTAEQLLCLHADPLSSLDWMQQAITDANFPSPMIVIEFPITTREELDLLKTKECFARFREILMQRFPDIRARASDFILDRPGGASVCHIKIPVDLVPDEHDKPNVCALEKAIRVALLVSGLHYVCSPTQLKLINQPILNFTQLGNLALDYLDQGLSRSAIEVFKCALSQEPIERNELYFQVLLSLTKAYRMQTNMSSDGDQDIAEIKGDPQHIKSIEEYSDRIVETLPDEDTQKNIEEMRRIAIVKEKAAILRQKCKTYLQARDSSLRLFQARNKSGAAARQEAAANHAVAFEFTEEGTAAAKPARWYALFQRIRLPEAMRNLVTKKKQLSLGMHGDL